MNPASIEEVVQEQLVEGFRSNPEVRDAAALSLADRFADRHLTEGRIERLMEESNRRWDERRREDAAQWEKHRREDAARWEENRRQWEEQRLKDEAKWEENRRQWEEHRRQDEAQRKEHAERFDEQNRAIVEQGRRSDAALEELQKQNQRLVEQGRRLDAMFAEFQKQNRKHDQSIGALGARWGLISESAFRDGLKAVLEDTFAVRVINWRHKDEEGFVRAYPSEVELDVIIHNGSLIVIEIKSSMSRPDLDNFHRSAMYYEKVNGVKADRLIVISPMVSTSALARAAETGIEICGYPEDMDPRLLQAAARPQDP